MSTPAYTPVMWIGGYSPSIVTRLQYDRSSNTADKPTLGSLNHQEPVGYTPKKITVEGMFAGTTTQALIDANNWLASNPTPGTSGISGTGDDYFNRPFAVCFFSQDQATPLPVYSDIVTLDNFHLEPGPGTGQYVYKYTMQLTQMWPVQYFATTTTINNSNTVYDFNMSSTDINTNPIQSTNGYIAGLMLLGSSVGTGGNALTGTYKDNSSATIGQFPALGRTGNQLFGPNNTQNVLSGLVSQVQYQNMVLPAVDASDPSNQSIAIAAITGTYSVTLSHAFATGHLPTAMYLVWVPL